MTAACLGDGASSLLFEVGTQGPGTSVGLLPFHVLCTDEGAFAPLLRSKTTSAEALRALETSPLGQIGPKAERPAFALSRSQTQKTPGYRGFSNAAEWSRTITSR